MSSGQKNVLFFGSISATIIGHDARNPSLFSQLEKQNASLKLRLTATAASFRSEEVLGSVSTSAPFPLDSSLITSTASSAPSSADPSPPRGGPGSATGGEETQNGLDDPNRSLFPLRGHHAFFLPLMLELAQDPAADGIPTETDSEAEDEAPSSASETGKEKPTAKGKTGRTKGGAADRRYHAVTVNISADISRSTAGGGSGRAVMVRSKRVVLPSLNKSAARDTCTVVRVQLSSRLITQSATPSTALAPEEVEKDVVEDVALSVYLMLRVVDLSERLSAAEEAVDDLQRFLGLPPPIPRLSLAFTRKVRSPYGVMPLSELYKHYRLFYSRHFGKVLKPHKEVEQMLTVGAPGLKEADESFPYRWNALEEVKLDRVLLGEEGFAPLLLTLSHCSSLRTLVADRNELGDVTCARLCALLSRSRYLRTVSLVRNNIYEGGADQLLRLVRRNHRLVLVSLEGNWCSDAIRKRIANATAASALGIQQDPLNVFAAQYDYLDSPHAIPGVTLKLALSVWAMLTAAPVGDVDVWVRNSTTRDLDQYQDESLASRQKAAKDAAAAPLSVIPPAARAPLLSEVMRTVYVGLCMAVPDPLTRSVFVDLEEARRRRLETLQGRADVTVLREEDGNSDEAGSDDSLAEVSTASSKQQQQQTAVWPPRGNVDVTDVVGDLPIEVARVLGVDKQRLAGDVDVARTLAEAEDDIYNASFLKLVVTVMRAIASGSPWDEVKAVLQGLGALHRSLGVRLEDYWLATHVFIKGLSVTLGTEEFTSERLASFLIVMALGIRTAATVDGVVQTL